MLPQDGFWCGCAAGASPASQSVHDDRRQSCTEYIRALKASIMLSGHYESTQHPGWQLFRHNASAFNEESGEISLSALARDISRGEVRNDCEKVSKTFKLVKAKAEVAEDIRIDLAGDDSGSEARGRSVKVDCPEVKATSAFFRSLYNYPPCARGELAALRQGLRSAGQGRPRGPSDDRRHAGLPTTTSNRSRPC